MAISSFAQSRLVSTARPITVLIKRLLLLRSTNDFCSRPFMVQTKIMHPSTEHHLLSVQNTACYASLSIFMRKNSFYRKMN